MIVKLTTIVHFTEHNVFSNKMLFGNENGTNLRTQISSDHAIADNKTSQSETALQLITSNTGHRMLLASKGRNGAS